MKKLLLATSALVGAGALVATASAGAPTLSIGGNLDFRIVGGQTQASAGATADPTDNTSTIDVGAAANGWDLTRANSRSEIKFRANGESDGGTKYGATIDYRYAASSTDEAYIYVAGDWGRVHLGDDDGALDHRVSNAGSIAPGAYLIDDTTTYINMESNSDVDGTKITYFTPNLGGFEAALSVYEQVGIYEDIIEAAISYGSSSGDVSYNVGVGIQSGSLSDGNRITLGAGPAGTFEGASLEPDSLSEVVIGGTLSFGAISLAASYNSEGDTGTVALPVTATVAEARDGLAGTSSPVRESTRTRLGADAVTNRDAVVGQKSEGREFTSLGIAYNLGDGMSVGASVGTATQSHYQSLFAYNAAGELITTGEGTDTAPYQSIYGGITEAEETQTLVALDFGFPILEGMSGYAGIAFSEWEREGVTVNAAANTINPDGDVGAAAAGTTTTTLTGANAEARGTAVTYRTTNSVSRDATTYVIGTTISF